MGILGMISKKKSQFREFQSRKMEATLSKLEKERTELEKNRNQAESIAKARAKIEEHKRIISEANPSLMKKTGAILRKGAVNMNKALKKAKAEGRIRDMKTPAKNLAVLNSGSGIDLGGSSNFSIGPDKTKGKKQGKTTINIFQ